MLSMHLLNLLYSQLRSQGCWIPAPLLKGEDRIHSTQVVGGATYRQTTHILITPKRQFWFQQFTCDSFGL